VKRTWTALIATGLLAATCGVGLTQQYNPPANGRTGGTSQPPNTTQPTPSHNPDPAGLMLAAFGTAAVFGHVLRQKRRAI
jgi:hypothetical protein